MGHLARAGSGLGPGVAMHIALGTARDDLAVSVVPIGMLDQGRNQQGLVLHQAQHGGLLFCVFADKQVEMNAK